MSRYTQNFSLLDIFNNPALKNKIPLVNYKEKELDNGKISKRTSMKTITKQVLDISTRSARPFYKPLFSHRAENTITLSGKPITDLNTIVDVVYNNLQAQIQMLEFTVNNMDMIRDALKESEKNKRNNGLNSKLYLRVQSMQQIAGMNEQQLQALMGDIMSNIIYGDDFPATQKKWNVENMRVNSPYTYEQRQAKWKQEIGDV